MTILLLCIGLLVLGYFTYGKVVERVFGPDPNRPTPCSSMADGVDYASMPTWKVFFIQLLDIAGVGPIFGPILGALYGPVALVWIVVGAIFAGAVHDYFSGMLSVRNRGASIPDVVGGFLGLNARRVMRFFSLLLLLLVGVVFVLSPAELLSNLTGLNVQFLVVCIFGYYFLATILPIDKLIGRLYPFFGALLMFMTLGVLVGMALGDAPVLPNLDVTVNTHPQGLPIWPLLFVTLSCGAISGFHSTQSPLMARCIRNESSGRLVFYGAMIAEGIVALVWAAAGMSLFYGPDALFQVIQSGTPSLAVDQICRTLLGPVGGFLAILGVIILPITSGDTAFRSSRLILAETFNLSQVRPAKRLLLAIPLFVLAFIISTQDFDLIWRYFGWSNQALAMLVLWTAAIYLRQSDKFHWIATIPAMFMTAVTVSFILQATIGFNLSPEFSNPVGVAAAVLALVVLLRVKPFTSHTP
ncbi:Carbon starvation protein CstA [Geoalkalibacter ferrihydriticus]|uniref:Carbon starvation protein CstA n=2 Tax=Geoalkalibacter ferrihydriticus TaxID=392333 RepID=A0A0C2DW95_9BACT|nr:carbon starvation CstA family protein [Geoalkalibacter ferrihydriticus]KIH77704.1 carbon starvation protein CstA [Geoalkalibacter ferrihydriticus DSM 17813]SDL74655.1 Carbon starvation protein CstA [Geoalkalibacter ferrihydriticus]